MRGVATDALEFEREVVIAVLAQRYGLVPDTVQRVIRTLDDAAVLHHLRETAEHAPAWHAFLHELKQTARDGQLRENLPA